MRLRLLAIALLAGFSSGCFVVEELDSARALLKDKPGEKAAEEAPTAAAPTKSDPDYWKKARTITPGEGTGGIVACTVRGQKQFMKRDDCVRRGGSPG